MEHKLRRIIDDFEVNRMAAGKAMRQLVADYQEGFFDAAAPLLREGRESQGLQYLLTLMLKHDMIVQHISDPEMFSFDQALLIAKMLLRVEPLLDIKMMRGLVELRDPNDREELEKRTGTDRGIRLLEILAAISDGSRILPVMAQLLHHPNLWVRSKAALLVGRSNKNHRWVEQQLNETDARVRANAIESLWGDDSEGAKGVFWGALADTNCRVVGNALLGLYLLGDPASVALLLDMSKNDSPEFRSTSIWVMGETGDQRFAAVLGRFLGDPNSRLRTVAFLSVAKLKQVALKLSGNSVRADILTVDRTLSSVTVTMAAWTDIDSAPGTRELFTLKPTQIVIQENGRFVAGYEVRETTHPESLSVAFAIPRLLDSNDVFQRQCEEAFDRALRHKRKSDSWLVVKYWEKARDTAQVQEIRRGSTGILHLNDTPTPEVSSQAEVAGLPENVRFTSDPAVIRSAVEAAGARIDLPGTLADAARTMLSSTSQSRGSRHMVLFLDTGNNEGSAWRDVIAHARKHRISIHVIALKESHALAETCAKTGGHYLPISCSNAIPRTLEVLCASMINQYQIRYQPLESETAASAPLLKLQVYAGQSCGECQHSAEPEFVSDSITLAG